MQACGSPPPPLLSRFHWRGSLDRGRQASLVHVPHKEMITRSRDQLGTVRRELGAHDVVVVVVVVLERGTIVVVQLQQALCGSGGRG